MVHHLLDSYGLLNQVSILNCQTVNDDVIQGFHSADYLEFLKGNIDVDDEASEEFGLGMMIYVFILFCCTIHHKHFAMIGYDCPPLEKLSDFVSIIAGASVTAAKALVSGSVDVAVNFCGGWHHAQRDCASGFCYVNDCNQQF